MDKVMQTFKSHDSPKLIPHILGMRTLRIGWVLRWKFKNGIVEKNKARSFTRRNHREPGIDYNRSFRLLWASTIHALLAVAWIPPVAGWAVE